MREWGAVQADLGQKAWDVDQLVADPVRPAGWSAVIKGAVQLVVMQELVVVAKVVEGVAVAKQAI